MQVNPGPPSNSRAAAMQAIEQDVTQDASRAAPRYEHGVLLSEEYQLQQRLRQEGLRQGAQHEAEYAHASDQYGSAKPLVGSEEWYKVRKENHKEVERRRRETINKGIDELAKVVPDCDKHKGQILQRTLDYIKKLKDNENQYMEKLTLEKLVAEQVISELQATNDKLKSELQQAWKDADHWKAQVKK